MYDVIVIGVGTMGAAACDCLSRRGAKVLGLERFSIPHKLGAHHGQSRMFRMAYYEHPNYVPLLRRAYDQWKELEMRSGVKLFHEVGGLYMGRPDGELMAGSLASARMHGLPHRVLSARTLEREFPQFVLPQDLVGLMEPHAGFVVPELAVSAMADLAVAQGAEILQRQKVVGWTASDASVVVRTAAAEFEAKRLVITAGAWAPRLLSSIGAEVIVTRQVLGWVKPAEPELFQGGDGAGFPCWGIGNEDGSLYYGFPMMPGDVDLKIALHAKGKVANPDHVDQTVTAADEETFRSALPMMPRAAGPTMRTAVCTYANSPDSHFVIDRHPHHSHVILACGFSGHGFKFAPAIGEVLADLALQGNTSLPVEFLGLRRFRK